MAITRYRDPLSLSYTNFLGNFFDDYLKSPAAESVMSVPRVNIIEERDDFIIEVAAPGMKKEDFQLTVDNNILTISSEHKEEQKNISGDLTRREFNFESFSRSFTLPQTVDAELIEAKYNDGILKLKLPKREEAKEKPARTIDIK